VESKSDNLEKEAISFVEGERYSFSIKGMVALDVNEEYFILEDTSGRKHLLVAEYYYTYNYQKGDIIHCTVDKINCSGKIFLEPEHPVYKLDKSYSFKIEEVAVKTNSLDEDVCVITVIDALQHKALCYIDMHLGLLYKVGDSIECTVKRIKKGRIYLSHDSLSDKNNLKLGEIYSFTIFDIKIFSNGKEYYLLHDEEGRRYVLPYEYYDDYNYSIGDIIRCYIMKFSSRGYYTLEPEHPYYVIDKQYSFTFLSQETRYITDTEKEFTIIVSDIFHKEVKFTTHKDLLSYNGVPETLICKVDGLKKGKPILSLVEENH